jgi:hypothetical protein
MTSPDPLQQRPVSQAAQWRLHRFTRAGAAADVQRDLREDIRAFFDAVLEEFSGEGLWFAATAPAKGGGVDVWFKLPAAPTDASFSSVWSRRLTSFGLSSQAVTGRN